MKRYNGKPMAHWGRLAHELVVDHLVRAALRCDEHSIVGELAAKRLWALANAEDAQEVARLLVERETFQRNVSAIVAPVKRKRGTP